MGEGYVVGVAAGVFGILAALITIILAMVKPISTRMDHFEQSAQETARRGSAELEKSEQGLKELNARAERIIRQTVEDVDTKLRREAELIEEKTRIQFTDIQRQLEQLRTDFRELRGRTNVETPAR